VNKVYTILFKVPELKRKILFTALFSAALFLAIYRIGFYIPLPIVDQAKLQSWQEQAQQGAAGKMLPPPHFATERSRE
jgi:preprotein translocase subunit SecY